MRFRCPSCGFSGGVRIPSHLPKGKTVRIRCTRCKKPFPLSLGRLFPQEYPAGYQALVADTLSCSGRKVGALWVETIGSARDRPPIVAFGSHPALAHDVMHDLLDPFAEYFRICYVEFPGTKRNPAQAPGHSYSEIFSQNIEGLKKHLEVSEFHLLSHLASAPLALDAATRHAESIRSLLLIEPDLRLALRSSRRQVETELKRRESGEELVESLLTDFWDSGLSQPHALGLARLLSQGLRAADLSHEIVQSKHALRYPTLSRCKTQALVLSSRDGAAPARRDAGYLQASLPGAQAGTVEKGGAWAGWFRHTAIANRMLSFLRGARQPADPAFRRRSQTLNGQPVTWMILLFAALAAGLTLTSVLLRFEPEFIPRVLPAFFAGLLPILWFVIPKKLSPLIFLRLNHLSPRAAGLSLAVGALLGVFFRSLLLTLRSIGFAPTIPAILNSIPPGGEGRLLELAGILGAGLFVFGVAQNLLVMRRSSLQILLPTLLFALLPPGYPDLLWKLPVGFTAAVLFAADCSLLSPLLLIVAFALTSELGIPLESLPIAWQGIPGVAATTLLLAAAIVLAVIPGTGGRASTGERLYFSATIGKEGQPLRWSANIGIVIVVFSLIGAAGLTFLFLAI